MLEGRLRFIFTTLLLLFALLSSTIHQVRAQGQVATATISGAVTDLDGKPVTDATVSINGPSHLHASTDANGVFTITGVLPGIYRIVVDSKTLGIASRANVAVTGDIDVTIRYEVSRATGLKTIAVVSTSGRVSFNVTPASTRSIDPSEAALDGETSWRRMFEQIPGVTTGGGTDGGLNTSSALPDSPFVPVELSINGGLPYETASLIDGMPIVNGTFNNVPGDGTDLSVMPMSAFSGADIVRGPGADSPSIIDSIGGSVIFHPATYVAHNSFDLSTSNDPYGGFNSTAVAAVRSNHLSLRFSYGVNDSPGPVNGEEPTFISFGTGYTINGNTFYCTGTCAPYSGLIQVPYTHAYLYNTGNIACCLNYSTAWSSHSGSAALSYDISPSINASLFYAGLQSDMLQGFPYEAWAFLPPAGYSGRYQPGLNFLQSAGPAEQDPIQQGASILEEKISAQLGVGTLQIAALQNRSYATQSIDVPQTITTHLWGGGAYGTPGDNTPVIFDGGLYTITSPYGQDIYDYWSSTSNHDLSLSYAFDIGESTRAGFSYVTQTYDSPEWVDSVFDGSGGTTETYPSSNYFSSDETRFFWDGRVAKRLSVDLSYYTTLSDYHVNDPDDAARFIDKSYPYAAPRLGIAWRPTGNIAIRAAAGGGFATAPLSYLIGTNGAPTFAAGQYSQVVTNVNLKPETSFGFDLGTDIRLEPDSVLSFDLYRSNLFGQVYETTQQNGTYNNEPLFVTEYGNLGVSRYEGLLIDVRSDPERGLFWRLSGGLTRAYVVTLPAGFYNTNSCTTCTNLSVVPGVNFNGSFTTTVPYSQGSGDIGYRWKRREYVGITANYFGPNNSYYQPAFLEFDANAGYPLTKYASLLVTFRNLTNVYGQAQQIYSPSNFLGAPTVAGYPYALYREPYGPRAVLVTAQFHV